MKKIAKVWLPVVLCISATSSYAQTALENNIRYVRNQSLHSEQDTAYSKTLNLPVQGSSTQKAMSPYSLSATREISFIGSSVALTGLSVWAKNKMSAISAAELSDLQRESVWDIDRGATYHYSSSAHNASNIFLFSSVAAPWLYITGQKTRKDFGKISLMHAETFLICWGITGITKALVGRPRPYVYNPHVPNDIKLTKAGKESFFSGHVSMTAAMSFFTATTFSQYYPDSKWKPLVWSYAVIWPAATGYFRYKAGKHFVSDIVIGYAVGAATGLLVPKLHQKVKYWQRKSRPQSNSDPAKVAWKQESL